MRILVTAASRHGSTAEIAARIGNALGDAWAQDIANALAPTPQAEPNVETDRRST